MSVTVGFSQATTSLIVPAQGTTKPDGTPADGGTDGGTEGAGEAGLFAALLAMLAPGAQPPAAEAAAPDPAPAATAPPAALPHADLPPAPAPADAPPLPELTDLQKSEQGKALLKDFAAVLKAAQQALDEGKPLDPALEKKLRDTVAAVAAWFGGQPLPPLPGIDTTAIAELASGGGILPAKPAVDLPLAPPQPTDLPDAPLAAGDIPAGSASPDAPKLMYAKVVPDAVARLGDVLQDFAAALESTSPDLAKAIAGLADRISVGDITDDVLAQLGLQRTPDSTSPELDGLVAALTAPKPEAKPGATPPPAIALPTLPIPDLSAERPNAARSEPKSDRKSEPTTLEPLDRPEDVKLEAQVKLEAKPDKPEDKPSADGKPATHAGAVRPADAPPPAAPPNASAPVAQAAAANATTATRAIHAAYAAPVQQINLPQVAFEVARHFEAGNTRFQIRLDPADLGRIDVKLDLDKNGTVNARLFVERPETLDLMLRDQRALQQALQQAGLDTSKTNLEFSLRHNPFAGTGADTGQSGGNGANPGFGPFGTPVADDAEPIGPTVYRGSASASGLNLFV